MALKQTYRYVIPLNRPLIVGNELRYIRDAVRRGHLSGDGHYTDLCSRWLKARLDVPSVLLTSSCTHALELAFLLLDAEPGQEVLCPSFTFPSTANAFVLRGLRPRFVEIDPLTLNMDPRAADAACTSKTIAITPVHYAGVPCDLTALMALASRRHLEVIEDAAQALGARHKKGWAGASGGLGAFSFHETKNYMCGEGGALAIRNPRYIRRAEILRQKGTNRERFLRGEIDKYSWVDVGSSFVPSELQTAYLYAQLERSADITRRRKLLHDQYVLALQLLEDQGRLRLPRIPEESKSAYHLFYVLLDSSQQRARVINAMKQKGIMATFHYFPLHLSTMGRHFGYQKGDFPVTEQTAARLLRLPFYTSMTKAEQQRVIGLLRQLV